MGRQTINNKSYQFWKQNYHPIKLDRAEKLKQQINYLHNNPVRSGLVWVRRGEWHYKHSSPIYYYTKEKGLIKIIYLSA